MEKVILMEKETGKASDPVKVHKGTDCQIKLTGQTSLIIQRI